jgi:hypothetical protein
MGRSKMAAQARRIRVRRRSLAIGSKVQNVPWRCSFWRRCYRGFLAENSCKYKIEIPVDGKRWKKRIWRPRCLAWVALGAKECINEAPPRAAAFILRFSGLGDPETGFRFQYKVILKNEEEAAQRPISFPRFWF